MSNLDSRLDSKSSSASVDDSFSKLRERLTSIQSKSALKQSQSRSPIPLRINRDASVAPMPPILHMPGSTPLPMSTSKLKKGIVGAEAHSKTQYETPVKNLRKGRYEYHDAKTTHISGNTPSRNTPSRSIQKLGDKDKATKRLLSVKKSKSSVKSKVKVQVESKNKTKLVQTKTHVQFQSVLRIRPFISEELHNRVLDDDGGVDVDGEALRIVSISHSNENSTNSHSFARVRLRNLHHNNNVNRLSSSSKYNHSFNKHTTPMSNNMAQTLEYKFDQAMGPTTTQVQAYEQIQGSTMAMDAVNPILLRSLDLLPEAKGGQTRRSTMEIDVKQHVIISMGVSNSGKTFSMFGGCCGGGGDDRTNTSHVWDERRLSDDGDRNHLGDTTQTQTEGIVPRLIDDLFFVERDSAMRNMLMQSSSETSDRTSTGNIDSSSTSRSSMSTNTAFGVEITMVHLYNDRIYDMLSPYHDAVHNGNRGEIDSGVINDQYHQHYQQETKDKKARGKRISNISKMIETFESSSCVNSACSGVSATVSSTISTNNTHPKQKQKNPYKHMAKKTLTSRSIMRELRIAQDHHTKNFTVKDPTVIRCTSSMEGRNVLNAGMKQNALLSTKMNKASSRGHTFITLRPVLSSGDRSSCNDSGDDVHNVIYGASITIIDMAGIERTKTSAVFGSSLRESVAINSSISAVLQCLRTIKANQNTCEEDTEFSSTKNEVENQAPNLERNQGKTKKRKKTQVVPYRQKKLTMLMQPLFSGSSNAINSSNISRVSTAVKMFVSVYPGMKDYHEKKALLGDIDALRGLSVNLNPRDHDKTEVEAVEDDDLSTSSNSHFSLRKASILSENQPLSLSTKVSPQILPEMIVANKAVCSPSCSNPLGRISIRLEEEVWRDPNRNKDMVDNSGTTSTDQSRLYESTRHSSMTKQSPLRRFTSVVKSSSSKKWKADMKALEERVRILDGENAALRTENSIIKKQFISLESKNQNLESLLRTAEEREKKIKSDLELEFRLKSTLEIRKQETNEKEFIQERKRRWDQQNLLNSELIQHMKVVEGTRTIFAGRVGNGLLAKSPFKLEPPNKQQRLLEEVSFQCSRDSSVEDASLESFDDGNSASA